MILHAVFLNLSANADTDVLFNAMMDLEGLVGVIDGFTVFEHGTNVDAEGKSPDHPYGFLCTFTDRAALDRYAADPRHRAIGARLVGLCRGGADGIVVYDLDTGPTGAA